MSTAGDQYKNIFSMGLEAGGRKQMLMTHEALPGK